MRPRELGRQPSHAMLHCLMKWGGGISLFLALIGDITNLGELSNSGREIWS